MDTKTEIQYLRAVSELPKGTHPVLYKRDKAIIWKQLADAGFIDAKTHSASTSNGDMYVAIKKITPLGAQRLRELEVSQAANKNSYKIKKYLGWVALYIAGVLTEPLGILIGRLLDKWIKP